MLCVLEASGGQEFQKHFKEEPYSFSSSLCVDNILLKFSHERSLGKEDQNGRFFRKHLSNDVTQFYERMFAEHNSLKPPRRTLIDFRA